MEYRYLVLGVNLILSSVLILIYGVVNSEPRIVGIAVSVGLMGAVVTVFSFSSVEPALEFLRLHSLMSNSFVVRLLEDLDLLSVNPRLVSYGDAQYMVYYKDVGLPDELMPGVGVSRGVPYLIVRVPPFLAGVEVGEKGGVGRETVEEFLSRVVVDSYGVASRVRVSESGKGVFEVRLLDIPSTLRGLVGMPGNAVAAVVMAVFNRFFETPVVLRGAKLSGSDYVLTVEVGGREG